MLQRALNAGDLGFLHLDRSMEIELAMARRVVWHGTADEALALLHAVHEHCNCCVERGRIVAVCNGHNMIARDQRAIDGLLFMRRMAPRLLAEEFQLSAATSPLAHVPEGIVEHAGSGESTLTNNRW